MTRSNSDLQIAFGSALAHAKQATSDLVGYLSKWGRAAWVWQNPDEQRTDLLASSGASLDLDQSIALACEIINAFMYADGQEAREVRICPGLIAVGREGIALAHTMNNARQVLAASLAAMEGRFENSGTDQRTGASLERPLREIAQEAYQAARLQFHQATRAIVTLDRQPTYAGFTWANCRKVFRSNAGAIRRLVTDRLDPERPDPLLMMDLKSLQHMSDDYPLAIVRPASLTPKVNLAWTDANGDTVRTIKRSVLPLLFVGDVLPKKLYELSPFPSSSKARSKRIDVELEEQPFLASVAAHRYIQSIDRSETPRAGTAR